MPIRRQRWPGVAVATAVICASGVAVATVAICALLFVAPAGAAGSAYVRVNQVGYVKGEPARALLMASGAETGATFKVVNGSGTTVFSGSVGTRQRAWSAAYPYVYVVDLAPLTTGGTYTIQVTGPIPAVSPRFQIGLGSALFSPALHNALLFYEAQRDGPNVISAVLGRQPSHLHDETASIYAKPSDSNVVGTLKKIGGPIDVSGGWFDAGDYLKFVETTSYVEAIILDGMRSYSNLLGASSPSANFNGEARFGLDWLRKMWNDSTETLYYQVGIGDGNGSTVLGDHDVWRLPQADDGLTAPSETYVSRRPTLRAVPPADAISPNLAGRLAADFALCFQVYRSSQPKYANACLLAGEHVFDLANTNPAALTTASPYGYYPETEWRDDLELGATELYFALASGRLPAGLPHTAPAYYLKKAAHWAKAYLLHANAVGYDTLNLYDVSGLAHYELYRAITEAGNPPGLEVTRANLLNDCSSLTGSPTDCGTMRDQLHQASNLASLDPFGLGFAYGGGDVVPHALGVAVEAKLYDTATATATFAALAQHQLDFVLGANAWGSSFVVGAGSVFPHCLQHQVANLAGDLSGHAPLLLGATVDGPNADTSSGLPGSAPGATSPRPCSVLGFSAFSGRGASYRDGVSDWPNTEPTIDYTALTILAFAQAAVS